MIIDTNNNFETPVRLIKAKVELYEGSTLANTYNQCYGIKEFTIERTGESKFFGFGICQKFNVHLIDKDRSTYISTANSFKVFLSTGENYVSSFPVFYVTETHRDENTNELSVTAYDAIYKANAIQVNSLVLSSQDNTDETPSYTIQNYAEACANALGVGLVISSNASESFALSYEGGANFEGTETIREALNAIAEATQTIYYIDSNNKLVFKRLDLTGEAALDIDKSKYITLESGENRRLGTITHTTELGDNISVSTGSTQYIRDNPFWELRTDIATLLDNALAAVGGLTINQFSCKWRGNPLLEIGDKISLTTKDDNTVISYLLNDTLSYNGSLSQSSKWEYSDNSTETENNPVTLGEAIKQTYARVDKANKNIQLVTSEVESNSESISSLEIDTEGISALVQQLKENTDNSLENVNDDITDLISRVEATMSADDVTLKIQTELNNGIDKVTTSTGYTFNDSGLTISKTGTEMSTTITEDGMTVYRDNEAVLVANNEGVKAEDLHATTYLIIGKNSRFEDYSDNRTGCFWIGN